MTQETKKQVIHDLDFDLIFECSDSIRFVGICTTHGQLLDAKYADGVSPLLSDSGLQFSVMKSSIRHATRMDAEGDLGKPEYSITSYENVKRATIPIDSSLLLLVSFEKNADEATIMQKIFEIIQFDK
ncbi:MAG: hypothetical protein DWQ18_08820 [Crenarchaeota archaeon]|nr:MAG: hypothetical protein DWQ17_00965 [Thermoproteota archaeon]RDJ33238.1 MAG: hypothetical protein DWQ18_08820 [Thermoproteota archaeon]RDJ36259.1 MAG: hypothetical protein DWQ19_06500 [Thermoproteota archaeon]RDJ38889.1 MAG: hypothetical protein DWQ13_00965 [Thermoproteota archaeon]